MLPILDHDLCGVYCDLSNGYLIHKLEVVFVGVLRVSVNFVKVG